MGDRMATILLALLAVVVLAFAGIAWWFIIVHTWN